MIDKSRLIEVMARKICEETHGDPDAIIYYERMGEKGTYPTWEIFIQHAEAALLALVRELPGPPAAPHAERVRQYTFNYLKLKSFADTGTSDER